MPKLLTFKEHFAELKSRVLYTFLFFGITSLISYIFADKIYNFLLQPLLDYYVANDKQGYLIYTNLTEAFVTYIKLAVFTGLFATIPFAVIQLYLFSAPAIDASTRKYLLAFFIIVPILFTLGALVAYYFIFPAAWSFFLSFEQLGTTQDTLPIKLEARIGEYLSLAIEIIMAFGLAFQLPVILMSLSKCGVINAQTLRNKRRVAIVVIFVVAAIITPPDVLSQVILASIMIMLYEMSILGCGALSK